MREEAAAKQPAHLQKLAEQAEIMADTTRDPNGKRALRFLALGYARLAEFARARTGVPGPPVKGSASRILDGESARNHSVKRCVVPD
jgi:hypothetical protein